VVVDPASQVPALQGTGLHGSGSRAAHGASGSSGARRSKAETTLVLQARRVDTLRRQVLQRQRSQLQGRRRQVVLWAVAGAGAVLLGGWLATRLAPSSTDRLEAPLVLGRSEAEADPPALDPPSAPPGDGSPAEPSGDAADPSTPRSGAAVTRIGVATAAPVPDEGAGRPALAGAQPAGARSPGDRSPDNRSPDAPKVVGDWGDGFDSTGAAAGHGRSSVRRGASASDAVNLDDLPTE